MKLTPRSFLARTILLILVPLVIALTIVASVFFDNHWDRVHATLARSLAGEISTMMKFVNEGDENALATMARETGVNVSVHDELKRPRHDNNHAIEAGPLSSQLKYRLAQRANIYIDRGKRLVFIDVPTNDGKIVTFGTSMHRIYSTSTEVFLIWLFGSLLIVGILVTPFLIAHTRSIRRIA